MNHLFKLTLLVVLVGFLYVAWVMKDDGRYVCHARAYRSQDILPDTRTGRLFYPNVVSSQELKRVPLSVEEDPADSKAGQSLGVVKGG